MFLESVDVVLLKSINTLPQVYYVGKGQAKLDDIKVTGSAPVDGTSLVLMDA